MHRFLVPPEALAGAAAVELTGAPAHQIARVLRLRAGETVVLFDGGGDEWRVRLTGVAPARVTGEVVERGPGGGEPRLRLTLYQALLKGDGMETVVRKGVEVGLAAIVPVVTARCVAREAPPARLTRWRRIAGEAAEQAGRALVPPVHPPVPLAALLADPTRPPLLVAWEGERGLGLAAALRRLSSPVPALGLLIGPEGGLTGEEAAGAAVAGATTVSLGPRVLRAETAGLVAASAVLFALGDLGGPPDA
jgi:16S rRNA (uracil1498-N3)-methyltransferase